MAWSITPATAPSPLYRRPEHHRQRRPRPVLQLCGSILRRLGLHRHHVRRPRRAGHSEPRYDKPRPDLQAGHRTHPDHVRGQHVPWRTRRQERRRHAVQVQCEDRQDQDPHVQEHRHRRRQGRDPDLPQRLQDERQAVLRGHGHGHQQQGSHPAGDPDRHGLSKRIPVHLRSRPGQQRQAHQGV